MESSQKKRAGIFVVVVAIAIIAILLLRLLPVGAGSRFDYIRSQAEKLNLDRGKIVAFVVDEIAYQEYDGVLRGGVGTLWGGRGNSYDQAILLHEMLAHAGVVVQYAGDDSFAWVQIEEGGQWSDVYPVKELEGRSSTWTGMEIPAEKFHRLEAVLIAKSKAGTEEKPLSLRTADLAGRPLILSFVGGAVLSQRGAEEMSVSVPMPDESLCITFKHFRPGIADPTVITREFYSKLYAEYRDESSSKNTHVIAALPCRLSQWAYDKEAELSAITTKRFSSQAIVDDYLMTLDFMRRSDHGLLAMEEHFETTAVIDEPRIIIASTFHGETEKDLPWRTLDLRTNRVRTDVGTDRGRSLTITRSIQDADLEAWVLSDATGGLPIISGFGVMGKALGQYRPSTPERLRVFSSAMENFLRTSRKGAILTFRVGKDRSIEFIKVDKDTVSVGGWAKALVAALDKSKIKLEILSKKLVRREEIGRAAWELEALFGPVAGMPTYYQPEVEIAASTTELLFDQARIFSYRVTVKGKPESLTFEYQMLSTDGDLVFESIDYWNEVQKRKIERRYRLTIPAKFREECDAISYSYGQSMFNAGTMFLMLSRKTYRELKEKGHTIVHYRTSDRRLSEPFKLYLCDTKEMPIYVNNQKRMVKFMRVAGGYAKDNLPKQDYKDVKRIMLTQYGAANKWYVLDNEDFPLINANNEKFQTSIPGKVVNEATGEGVPDAEIVVEGTGSNGRSWGDGQFELPLIKKKFSEFVVTAKRRGYHPLRAKIDFAKADTFPLKLKMKPKIEPDDFVWINAKNVNDTIGKVKGTTRTKDNILRALRENPSLVALVPRGQIPYHMANVHAWVLFDPDRYHLTAVTEDGLHSAIAGAMIRDLANNASAGGDANPYDMQQGIINYYAGFIASWYVYSAGKLEALSGTMDGKDFSDLGHAHAIKFAQDWLKGMSALFEGASGKIASDVIGVKADQYKAGFADGLSFFEKNPEYRGK